MGRAAQKACFSDSMVAKCTHGTCQPMGQGSKEYRMEMDVYGAHASACCTNVGPKMTVHNAIQKVFEAAGFAAGMLVQHEPTAYDLMRGRYSAGECRVLFPSTGTVNVAQAAESTVLRKGLDAALDDQTSSTKRFHDFTLRVARNKIQKHGETIFVNESEIDRHKFCAGMRPDIAFVEVGAGADGEDIEHWVDVRGVHELGHTALPNSYRHAVAWADHKTNPGQQKPVYASRAMLDGEKRKRRKYAPLVEAATKYNAAIVVWAALLFTVQGLLGDEAEALFKTISGCYAKMLAKAPPDREAVPLKFRQTAFEMTTRNSLAAVCARGQAKLLREVGVPKRMR
jgi:hypothetical protein